ncbi:MAG: acyl-CoA/acyl-ACP dehydrogenase [Myxococcota bacterium]|nr:acyl-CoA/acyl-ACP dehydrogenase [Myxococcota bacterium]
MDFGLSDDQKLLDETVRGYLADQVPIARIRELREKACPNDRDLWKGLAELGLTGVLIPEDQGGSALSLLDATLVSQALGHAVTPSAFLSSSVMVPIALQGLEHPAVDEFLAGIATGELIVGAAVTEGFSIREEAGVKIKAGRLHGKAMMALDAVHADFILILIDEDRVAMVRGKSKGLTTTRLLTTDATRCTAELILDGVEPEALFEGRRPAITRMFEAGRIALAADAFGAAESMIDQAVHYALDRKQFDRVIGSFQAVKHMCAEMIADLEPVRSLIWYAAHSFDALPGETPLMACHALSHMSEVGRNIASVATQVHGGIGWTDEQNLHFWFKRIGVDRHLLGGPEWLRLRAAELQGLAKAS